MSIKRMLMLASMALAAIAFGAPAAAQGEAKLTNSSNQALGVGAPVTATSTNLITTVQGGAILECKEVVLHYRVAANGPEQVVLNPEPNGGSTAPDHNATTKECVTNAHAFGIGTHTNIITHAGAEQLTLNTAGTGVATATFTSDTPTLGSHCSYHGGIPVQATDGTDVLHVETVNTLVDTKKVCGDGEMHGDFTVTTTGNDPVSFDFSG